MCRKLAVKNWLSCFSTDDGDLCARPPRDYHRPRMNPTAKAASSMARRVATTILGECSASDMSGWTGAWSDGAPFDGSDGASFDGSDGAPFDGADGAGRSKDAEGDSGGAA